ncbi:amino acid transporter [Herbiconiux sp. L3-i23]|nr:amino acid transporter [Herbiconiux sp. L3-i23]
MVGAGVFSVFAPAAAAAGGGILVALVIAGFVAFCNAMASAQLAVQYPRSGGTYVYGRERLGPWAGYLAGWSFVVGKTASCAAMAMTFAAYAVPEPWQRPVAALAVVVLGIVGGFGVTRTALVARIVVVLVLLVLVMVVIVGFGGGGGIRVESLGIEGGPLGILSAAGLLFFAFAGYARIATLAEEVRDPRRTIPRAVIICLVVAFGVYLAVAFALLTGLGPERLEDEAAPLSALVSAAGFDALTPVVAVAAALASLGALLALMAGVSRTALAMGREDDLPRSLARVSRRGVPYIAEATVTVVVVVLVLSIDLRGAIGFSSFGVLLYYLIANIAAATQRGADRLHPRVLDVVGAVGCVVLVVTLPPASIVAGAVVVLVGAGLRLILRSLCR